MNDIRRYLEAVTTRKADPVRAAISDLLVAIAHRDRARIAVARQRVGEVMRETLGAASILGAVGTLRRAAAIFQSEGQLRLRRDAPYLLAFAGMPAQQLIPQFSFDEAARYVTQRVPVTLTEASERTAERISQLYSEDRVIAFVHATEQAVTERVQQLIAEAVRQGTPESQVGSLIRMSVEEIQGKTKDWTDAYSRMVFRTNMNTALTAGEFEAARDPDIMPLIPCKRFDAIGDSDTRLNHKAADGLIMRVTNPAWRILAPPIGYNCRCSAVDVTLPELRRRGRVDVNGEILEDVPPPDAYPDPGFRVGPRADIGVA